MPKPNAIVCLLAAATVALPALTHAAAWPAFTSVARSDWSSTSDEVTERSFRSLPVMVPLSASRLVRAPSFSGYSR